MSEAGQAGIGPTIRRRELLGGLPIAAGLTLLPSGPASASPGASKPTGAALFDLAVGEILLSVVSDGPLPQGDPVRVLEGQDPDAIRALLKGEMLSDTDMTLDQNVVVLRTGDRVALVDTGTGGDSLFGPRPGKLMGNLRAVGIDPASVTDVLLTHGHPDHMWGLVDLAGEVAFPQATVHLSEADHRFFSDPASDGHPKLGPFMRKCRSILKAVEPRFEMVRDGQEVLPGVVGLSAPGHTPGHFMYRLQSGDAALMLGGDIAHHHVIFPRHPDVRFAFDTDPAQMVETRKRAFDMLAADRLRLLAYHFPFPGAGHLVRSGAAYRWVPLTLDSL